MRTRPIMALRKRRKDGGQNFKCLKCEYTSIRRFNVSRHYERIHYRKRLRECCGITFYTKGEYYIHCAKIHPKNWRSVIFMQKYGINMPCSSRSSRHRIHMDTQKSYSLGQEYNDKRRHSLRSTTRYKSSFPIETTLTEFDLENIPLINFLRDPSLINLLRTRSFEATDTNTINTNKFVTEISESSIEQSEILVNEESEENMEISDLQTEDNIKSPSLSHTAKLPTKKLILDRYINDSHNEFRKAFQTIENNEYLINRPKKDALLKNVRKLDYPMFNTDKENSLNVQLEIKHKVIVEIDKNIPLSLMTNMHRDFLSSFDFTNVP